MVPSLEWDSRVLGGKLSGRLHYCLPSRSLVEVFDEFKVISKVEY
jgi:hypothetical protein